MVTRVHGGNLEEVALNHNIDSRKVIDFSSNINPYGPPKAVIDYMNRDNLEDVINYPDINCTALKSALAKKLGLSVKNLVVTNGSSEAISLLVNHFLPQRALIVSPTFCEYEIAVVSTGGKIKKIKLQKEKKFAFSLTLTISELEGIEMLFLCNPNNPTGNLHQKDDLVDLLKEARKRGVFCVVDEAFMDFIENKGSYTLKPLMKDFNNLAVLGTLTKFYSLAGLRVGYLVSNEVTIAELTKKVPAWNINGLAQKASIIALNDWEFEDFSVKRNIEAKNLLYANLSDVSGLKVYPSQANFLLVEVLLNGFESEKFYFDLLRCGFYVRNCASFDGLSESFFRVAVRLKEENLKLVGAIKKILKTQI